MWSLRNLRDAMFYHVSVLEDQRIRFDRSLTSSPAIRRVQLSQEDGLPTSGKTLISGPRQELPVGTEMLNIKTTAHAQARSGRATRQAND